MLLSGFATVLDTVANFVNVVFGTAFRTVGFGRFDRADRVGFVRRSGGYRAHAVYIRIGRAAAGIFYRFTAPAALFRAGQLVVVVLKIMFGAAVVGVAVFLQQHFGSVSNRHI